MAAPSTYTPEQKAAMAELTVGQGMAIRTAQATLAAGYKHLEPFRPSHQTIADEARKARQAQAPNLTDQQPSQILDGLTRRSLATIDKYVRTIEATPSRFDPDDMLKIMRTLVEAKGLVQPTKQKHTTEPTGVAGKLAIAPEPAQNSNTQGEGASPVSARAAS